MFDCWFFMLGFCVSLMEIRRKERYLKGKVLSRLTKEDENGIARWTFYFCKCSF